MIDKFKGLERRQHELTEVLSWNFPKGLRKGDVLA
jgi:hypothetical protein